MTQGIWLGLMLAAACYGWSAWSRRSVFAWFGLGFLTLSLLAVFFTTVSTGLATAVLSLWSAGAALVFVTRFGADTPRLLTILPLAAVALSVGIASLPGAFQEKASSSSGLPAIAWVHMAFMIGYCAASLVAGGSSAAFLVANRQLKRDPLTALSSPALPRLSGLVRGALVVAAAFLVGGLSTGGAALGGSASVQLLSPLPIIGLVSMLVVMLALGLHQGGKIGRFGLIGSAFLMTILATVALVISVVRGAHG
jgi:hypothetical protein